VRAQDVLPVPALTARVVDQTGTLDPIQRKGLEDKLAAFEQKKGTQIVVLLVATTQPEDIASYANRVANDWKIGRKEVGDGIVVIVAKDDRKVRIEVAKTLEGAVPDLAAKQIIDDAITPRFPPGRLCRRAAGRRRPADRAHLRRSAAGAAASRARRAAARRRGLRLLRPRDLPVLRGAHRGGGAARRPRAQARLAGHRRRRGCPRHAVHVQPRGGGGRRRDRHCSSRC
jgi:uncharacterized protein